MELIRKFPVQCVIVAILALTFYLPTRTFDFAYDDVLQIKYNSLVTSQADSAIEGYGALFLYPTPPGNLYRPLTLATYRANYELSGLDPEPYHLFNTLLYAAVCVLVFILLTPILRREFGALLAASLFAIHPIHVEVVANVISRAELLATFFGLLACMTLRQVTHEESISKRGTFAMISVFCFLLACLSKESALVFFALAPLYALFGTQQEDIKQKSLDLWLIMASYGASSALVLLLRKCALGASFLIRSDGVTVYAENPIFHLSFIERFIPALRVLGEYLKILVFPLHLSSDYSQMPGYFLKETYSFLGLSSVILIVLLVAVCYRFRAQAIGFLSLWFLIAFALTSNIVTTIGTIMGERLAFLPSVGAIALIALLLLKLFDKNQAIGKALIVLALLFYGLRTYQRVPIWISNDVLFAQTLKDAPLSPKARYNLASHLYQQDKSNPEIRKLLIEAVKMNPGHIFSLRLLADIALERGKLSELEHWYGRILEVTPDDETVKSHLSELRRLKDKLREAKEQEK